MSDFTPALDEVRAIYALGTPAHHVSIGGSYAEFDRAIAKVRAEAKAEAVREAADALEGGAYKAFTVIEENRMEERHYIVGVLRNRADKLDTL